MKKTALILMLAGTLACADDRVREPQPLAPNQPVGSTGTAPATPSTAPATPTNPVVTPATKPASTDPVPPAKTADRAPEYREIVVPAGTVLPLELQSTVASDTSRVEDPVRATLRRSITVHGVSVLPAGSAVAGHVTQAARSAKVKGRARIAFRFNSIDLPGEGGRMTIQTGTVARVAPGTKKRDTAEIGGAAAGGAIIGGILGGGKGAAKGAAIGGAAGTGVVLNQRGKEVRLPAGTAISVKLTSPLTVRVRA
jgi:hypothetical protein